MEITLETFERAAIFAVNAHSGQTRKGGDKRPYICHPFSVMLRIFNNKASKNMYLLACAALLHDTVEDVEWVTIEVIFKEFGPQIASLVAELTLDKSQYEKIGKKEYLAQELNVMSSYALAIKLCDRLDNCSDLDTMDEDFRKYYIKQTRYILSKLDRHLSPTHKRLIKQINDMLDSYLPECNKTLRFAEWCNDNNRYVRVRKHEGVNMWIDQDTEGDGEYETYTTEGLYKIWENSLKQTNGEKI